MEPKLNANRLDFNRHRRTRSSRARAIPFGAYFETPATRVLLMIGLAVLAGVTASILAALPIL
jgi:hypothetical protein